MTPERKAEIRAFLYYGGPMPKPEPEPKPQPKVIATDGVVARDADVHVSPADPNARRADADGVVRVRPPGWVTVNLAEYERQQAERAYQRALDRQHRRELDPYRLSLYGPLEDDE